MTIAALVALLLLVIGGMVGHVGERLFDWLIPPRLNFRLAAVLAKLAIMLAYDRHSREEAQDAFANVLVLDPDGSDFSPIAAVLPVLARCALSQWSRTGLGRRRRWAYKHTNSKGVTYYLNSKMVTLRGGVRQNTYYFSKQERPETAAVLPRDRFVSEYARNGFLTLARKELVPTKSRFRFVRLYLRRAPGWSRGRALAPIRSFSQRAAVRLALRSAVPFAVPSEVIDNCLDVRRRTRDDLFKRARQDGLSGLEQTERGWLAGVTGSVAESVAAFVLDALGYTVFWQLTRPGSQGVDLLLISPEEEVLALEVKGTLRRGQIPVLTAGQMSVEWLSADTNQAMREWGLTADDVYGGVMVVDLAAGQVRIALTADFEIYHPIEDVADMASLAWLADAVG